MSTTDDKAFLVFGGGNDRAVIGFLRALRLCGKRAHVVARTAQDRILQTSYRRDVRWVRRDHTLSLEVFSECLAHVRTTSGQQRLVVLPSTEYFNAFILEHRAAIERMGCEVPLVDAALYETLTNKRTATRLFARAGVPPPEEPDPAVGLQAPVVAKPRSNISTRGESLYPHLLITHAQLTGFLDTHDPDDYFFQEYVDGESLYLLFYLSPRSGREFVWSQRNLLQQPDGKSMLLAEASRFHESETAAGILGALRQAGFHGLGMVEVIHRGERHVFVEMNPRIWGPIQFCVDQRQPLLQAFVGDCLHADTSRFLHCLPRLRRRRYFWLGGLVQVMRAGNQPTWHARRQAMPAVIARNLAHDVYLRHDSWRCFSSELMNPAT